VKFSKRLINVAVHNAFGICNSRNKTYLIYRSDLIKALILTYKPQAASPAGHGRPSIIHSPPERLLERHYTEKIPPTGKKAKLGT
jgi:hypothetical protein